MFSSSVPFFLFTHSPKPRHLRKPFPSSFQTLAMAKSLDESDVGIYCYVSSLPGFKAILKQRYSDFIVNEVDLDGSIVRLTSFDLPPDCSEEEEENSTSLGQKSFIDEIELFQTLAGEANAEIFKEFLQKVAATVDDELPPIVLAPDSDKFHRAEVHNFFKKNFKFLVTDTVDGEDMHSKCIRIRFSSGKGINGRRGKKRKDMGNSGKRNDTPFDSRGADNWPEEQGKFLRFHLYKENKDTHEALGVIGKMLGIQQRSFGFAGTKDKRAVTTQRVTVFKLHPKRLAALNCRLFGIKIGDFCFVKKGLLLGQLQGNRFTITLRDVVADLEDTIIAAADGLGRSGFINYYGLQRFGSGSVPTHQIGAALLRGEWKTAVDLILDPKDGERSAIKEAREKYKQTGDVDLMLRQLPHHLVAERAIIHCLKKCPGNYLQALQSIPRTLRLMYVHSYQSYLWNHAASMRVQKHGIAQVVLGDLVFCKDESSDKIASFETVEPICEADDGEGNSSLPDISDATLPEEKIQLVKTINSDDLVSGGYTFEDVVLPIPGSRTIYPGNDIAGIYHDISKKDGISLTESAHNVKEFSITNMTGDYRLVFQRPIDYTWELLTYKDNNESLAKTDLDVLSGPKTTDLVTNKNSNTSLDGKVNYPQTIENDESDSFVSEDQNGKIEQMECNYNVPKVALKLGFTLPASCYATMAIRELLKSSTLALLMGTEIEVKDGGFRSKLKALGSFGRRDIEMFFRADKIDLKRLDIQLAKQMNNSLCKNKVDLPGNDWEVDLSKLELKYELARGTYGIVYKGIYDGRYVAVKLMDWGEDGFTRQAETVALRESFQKEVVVWHNLDHPNVTKFIGASMGTNELKIPQKNPASHSNKPLPARSCCVVVEYIPCGTLKQFLIRNSRKKLAYNTVIKLALDLSRGLSYLHSQKIVHRDVKTENMLLDRDLNLKIADFGVARVEAQNPKDMTGETGTLGYMAPEVLDGKPYNRKCDVYSFGICLWELYCCDMPYWNLSFAEISFSVVRQNMRPEIPRCCPTALANIMRRCWDPSPDARPEMDEVVVLLEAINTSKGGGMISDDKVTQCFCFKSSRIGP